MFRYLVLGLLRDGAAYHGYALMKEYRERSGVSVSTGNFYRELQRLVAEGLVRTAQNPPGADTRREPYEITEEGSLAFDAWLLSSPANVGSYDDELSSRAVFVAEREPAEAHALLDRWREAIWIHGKTLERERERALAQGSDVPRGVIARSILLARRLKHVAADLEFIEELRSACFPPVTLPRVAESGQGGWTKPVPAAAEEPAAAKGGKSLAKKAKLAIAGHLRRGIRGRARRS